MLIYLDIETFSENGFRSEAKIISIQYRTHDGSFKMFREWESSEKDILQKFLSEIKMMKHENFLILVGHNILRFDLPTLIKRMAANGIDSQQNLEDFFHSIATLDTMQCMIPFNGMRFKGLNMDGIAAMIGWKGTIYKNSEIESFYKNKDFKKIEQHAESDTEFVKELYWRLKSRQINTNEKSNSQERLHSYSSHASRGRTLRA